ncbi:uncharacterized protein LOC114357525 [Ostrinia furnacalis]|uniref:uncharacterized protein LOC114357525 n=1 Tax=Ostrinia furnacalis TaxID=93504 RepID=UPI00103A594E|nr:uncharacterized protein LOC114357525 [Ostrinia furnacalis]
MPALWQSSQRPMYVRTVWVDGFRHAILSQDDPYFVKLSAKRRRPTSSASTSNKIPKRHSRLSNHADDLEGCLRKLNLVIRNDRTFIPKTRPKSSKDFEIEKLNLTDVDNESEDGFLIRATPQQLNDYETSRSNFDINMRHLRVNRTSRLEVKENTELSERVLQWLDLAGKVDLLAPENAERMAQPRHSWPEIQRRNHGLSKSKTTVDVRAKDSGKTYSPKAGDSAKPQQSVIDRHDFYVPTSTNTIENYARQSRNARGTPQAETSGKKDANKTKSKDIRANVAETRQKVVSERTAVEKQYADLIKQKLIPGLGIGSKKQVHIFMPELPKKFNSTSTSRTESLLSSLKS